MATPYVTASPVAPQIPFDNSTNGFLSNNVQNAIEELNGSSLNPYFGDGSDGDVSLSSGTTTLVRTMYYNSLTLTGTALVNTNGFKIYVRGTLSLAGTSSITRTPNNGGSAVGQAGGTGAAALTRNDMGAGSAGQNGVNGAAGGLGGSAGVPGIVAGSMTGYGGAGGSGGTTGSGTGGAAGTYTFVPERVIRHDHIYLLDYKNAGQGGASGGGGPAAAFGTGGGSGAGGSGGGTVFIFCNTFNNTSSVGLVARGGNGGAGGAAAGNANGGGGGAGGGGGFVYLICLNLTAMGTINVTGGTGGAGGALSGTGSTGGAGSAGSVGHYSVFSFRTNAWTVT